MNESKADWMSLSGIFLSIVTILIIFAILSTNAFPIFEMLEFEPDLVKSTSDVGQQTANILWSRRYPDLIAQAFLIFASAACCIAMLRPHIREKMAEKRKDRLSRFEVYKDSKGEFRFRLRAPNNEIIVVGEAYKSKASCLKGIGSIKRNAAVAEIEDQTLEE